MSEKYSNYAREQVALCNADYEQGKIDGFYKNTKEAERFWKIKAGSLQSYRCNRYRRLRSGISVRFRAINKINALI